MAETPPPNDAAGPPAAGSTARPRLLDRVRERIRYRHYSYRTERAYVDWVRRFVRFHGLRHPQDMGAKEIEAFLSHLATVRDVAASTHNQPCRRSCSSTVTCSASSPHGIRAAASSARSTARNANRDQAPAWNGRPSEAGALSRISVGLREMIASTTIVAT